MCKRYERNWDHRIEKALSFFFFLKEQFSRTLCERLIFTYAWYKNRIKTQQFHILNYFVNVDIIMGYGNYNLHKSERPFFASFSIFSNVLALQLKWFLLKLRNLKPFHFPNTHFLETVPALVRDTMHFCICFTKKYLL